MIVCDSGPLIALEGIGKLDLLKDLFGEVLVVQEVRAEVERGRAATRINLFSDLPWLQTVSLKEQIDPLLGSLLDSGEAATIALARQTFTPCILIDEVKGRRVARDIYKLHVIGTGRVLVEAKRASLINCVEPLLNKMRSRGYWLADAIVTQLLHEAEE